MYRGKNKIKNRKRKNTISRRILIKAELQEINAKKKNANVGLPVL
jgi:hypothetical protein